MLVLVNVGPQAGNIQDIEPSAAKQMLSDGRASVPQYDQGNGEPEGVVKLASAPVSGIEPDAPKSAKTATKKK